MWCTLLLLLLAVLSVRCSELGSKPADNRSGNLCSADYRVRELTDYISYCTVWDIRFSYCMMVRFGTWYNIYEITLADMVCLWYGVMSTCGGRIFLPNIAWWYDVIRYV